MTLHLHSAASSDSWTLLNESLQQRRSPLNKSQSLSSTLLRFPNVKLPFVDEEKGRKFSPSNSAASLHFAWDGQESSSYTPPSVAQGDDNDADIFNDWVDERAKQTTTLVEEVEETYVEEPSVDAVVDGLQGVALSAPDVHSESALWARELAKCVEEATGTLDLSGSLFRAVGLTFVPASINDLTRIVKIVPDQVHIPLPSTFSRTSSAPSIAFGQKGSPAMRQLAPRKAFARTQTMPAAPISPNAPVQIELNLSQNHITADALSWRLFEMTNLALLSLAHNPLTRLPEGIGRLSHLAQLDVSRCSLEFLPAEMLQLLDLQTLSILGNAFLPAPPHPANPSSRLLGPKVIRARLPSLASISQNRLLLPDSSISPVTRRQISYEEIEPRHHSTGLFGPFHTTLFPSLAAPLHGPQPFDPDSHVCRSPAHQAEERPFVAPAVERMEWISEASLIARRQWASGVGDRKPREGSRMVPILHRGCGVSCLDWLEQL